MHSYPLVSIVILNYNGRNYLQQFLPSVVASSYANKRIIIADNASTDDSIQWLTEHHPLIEIIALPTNFGFAKGYNEALKQVESDYYVLLNSDVEVTTNWIEPIIQLMETDKTIAACQPKMLDYHNKQMFEYAGGAGGWIDPLGYPFSRGRIFDECEQDTGQYDSTESIFWASGAAFFVRSSVYHEMQGFDEYFFAHQEEIDLCWRMQLSGYKIMACPASVVYHVGGGTLPKGERKTFLNFRNNLVMVYKNWRPGERLWKLPLRIMLDLVSAFKTLAVGNVDYFKGVCKAEWTFLGWMIRSKKQNIFAKRKKRTLNGVFRGSVIVQHFLLNKKTFAEIVLNSK